MNDIDRIATRMQLIACGFSLVLDYSANKKLHEVSHAIVFACELIFDSTTFSLIWRADNRSAWCAPSKILGCP